MQRYPLGQFSVARIGLGAMQLPGPGVFGPPRDRDAALSAWWISALGGALLAAESELLGEALEEAGVRLQTLEPVGAVFTIPGISTERMHLFLAVYGTADRIGEGGGLIEEHEGTRPVETTLLELSAMADAGTLADLKTLALLQTLRTRRPDLFAG